MKAMLAAVAAAILLAGCAGPAKTGSTYTDAETRRPMAVSTGTILGLREVRLERNQPTGTGAAAGAVIGGVAGSGIGGGRGSIIGSVAGAVVGGVAGSHAEKAMSDRPAWEITVRSDDGQTMAIVQEAGDDRFAVGQRVRMLTDSRGQVRVSPL